MKWQIDCYTLGSSTLVLWAAQLTAAALLFALHRPLTPLVWLPAFAVVVGYNFACLRARAISHPFPLACLHLVLLLLLVGVCAWVSMAWYDLSYDGMWYHQEAVYRLAHGWNPFTQHAIAARQPDILSDRFWIEHYPKGTWLLGASLYQLTGHIEAGKAFNLLLCFAVCLLLIAHLRALSVRLPAAILLSLLAAGNPVSLSQLFTFYNDGALVSLWLCLLILLHRYYLQRSRVLVYAASACLLLLVNCKFSGVVFAFLALVVFMGCCVVTRRSFARPLGVLGLATAIGVLVVGYQPYLTNLHDYGNPCYPLLGRRTVDIISNQVDGALLRHSRFERLLLSLFSATQNNLQPLQRKYPFELRKAEQDDYRYDTRIGGFGPWFGPILLLGLIAFLAFALVEWRRFRLPILHALVALLTIFLCVLLFPENWWARYVPMLWLVPLVTVGLLLCLPCARGWRIAGGLLVLLLAGNLWFSAIYWLIVLFGYNRQAAEQLHALAAASRLTPFSVQFQFHPHRIRLEEAGVRFVEVSSIDESRPHENLFFTKTLLAAEKKK